MDDVLLDQREVSELLDFFGDKEVLIHQAILLLPLEKVFGLLDISFRQVWEASRGIRRGLPTFKTGQTFADRSATRSRSSQEKFLRALPMPRRAMQLARVQVEQGYNGGTAVEWLGFIELSRLSSPVVLDYWEEKLHQLSEFSGPTLHALSGRLNRLRAYNDLDALAQLGCPASRELLPGVIEQLESATGSDSESRLAQLLAADAFSALLRLAAWFNADYQVTNWEFEVQEGTQHRIHAAWVIPSWCAASSSWSDPMAMAFARLAELAGWNGRKQKPVTYLGKLWAAHDGMEASSRIRLLRNWLQLKPGRPSFQKLVELVQVCCDLHMQTREALPEGAHIDHWQAACTIRFAETMALLLRDLQRDGWPQQLLASMFSVYDSEYRIARQLMGKPLET